MASVPDGCGAIRGLILALPAGADSAPPPRLLPELCEPRRSQRASGQPRAAGWEERLEVSGAGGCAAPPSLAGLARAASLRPLLGAGLRAQPGKLGARRGRKAAVVEDSPCGLPLARVTLAASGRPLERGVQGVASAPGPPQFGVPHGGGAR